MLKKAFPWLYEVDPEPAEEGEVVQAGEKVVLREKRQSDIDEDYGWRVDEELSRLDATRPITMSYEAFRNYAREEMQYATSTSKRLAIDTLDGVHIGNCMYYDINRRRGVAELGIMIGEKPLSAFDEFVDQWKSQGGDQMTQEVNEWWAARS